MRFVFTTETPSSPDRIGWVRHLNLPTILLRAFRLFMRTQPYRIVKELTKRYLKDSKREEIDAIHLTAQAREFSRHIFYKINRFAYNHPIN